MQASDVTPDGSPVPVYLALPASPEFDAALEALPGNGSVLDLGCGTGRLSNLLVGRGYDVVAVDESPTMLAHVNGSAEAVRGRIEELDLGRRFDVVMLAGNLINTADVDQRGAFLSTVRRHLRPAGRAFIQRYDPGWAATVTRHQGTAGEVRVDFEILDRDGSVFEARSTYHLGQRAWDQQFRARIVDDGEFAQALESSGLRLERWLTERWATATRA
ncbi:MAG: class I SAM-dependent methyltransferase [Actinobacteria bacterium]|nr:class I SAM-dependent methyltransferase [Actinomycetota bacterium]